MVSSLSSMLISLSSSTFIYRCLNYGILSHKRSEKLYAIVMERKKRLKAAGGASPSPAPKKKKAKIVKDEEAPDLTTSSNTERVGSTVL